MKSFTHADEIEAFGLDQLNNLLKAGNNMLVNKERADHWATKGFDGITDLILDRSNLEKPVEENQFASLDKVIRLLEECLRVKRDATTQSLDNFLFQGLEMLTFFLHRRVFEMGLGGLDGNQKERISVAINNLKIARERFIGHQN